MKAHPISPELAEQTDTPKVLGSLNEAALPVVPALMLTSLRFRGTCQSRTTEAISLSKIEGRAGRWAALIAIGATVRAADLSEVEPYREPRPMEKKQVRVGHGVRFVDFDREVQPEEAAVPA